MGIRSKISGSDFSAASQTGYLKGGFGIVAARQPKRIRPIPVWMYDEKKIREFINKQFPNARTFGKVCQCDQCTFSRYKLDRSKCRCRWCRDTIKAARWATVIYRWFLMEETDSRIESEHGWKPGTVGSIVQKIRRLTAGQRQDGIPRTGKPVGRPKKIGVSKLEIPDNQKVPMPAVDKIESTVFANSC